MGGKIPLEGLDVGILYEISEVRKDGTIYLHNPETYRFRISDQGKITDELGQPFRQNQINFPNQLKPMKGEVTAIKKGSDGLPLAGAEFGLYKEDLLIASGTTEIVTVPVDGTTTKEVAKVTFPNLEPGTYVLKEIKAPKGYVTSSEEQTVTIPMEANESMIGNGNYVVEDDVITKSWRGPLRIRNLRWWYIRAMKS